MSEESKSHPVNRAYAGYWERAQWPLQGLYFLMPLLVLYELGTWWQAPAGGDRLPPNLAESLLGLGFEQLGVTGVYLPAIIVVVVLSCMHLVRRDPWKPELKLHAVMWVEAFAWSLPLFVFMLVLVREFAEQTGGVTSSGGALQVLANAASSDTSPFTWQDKLVFSVGAGIYEELLFRLIGIALLHMLLVDVLALPEKYGGAGAVVITTVAFALYHFLRSSSSSMVGFSLETLDWGRFAFYMLAGFYLATIYLLRGFGLVVGAHALFDVMVVTHNELIARAAAG